MLAVYCSETCGARERRKRWRANSDNRAAELQKRSERRSALRRADSSISVTPCGREDCGSPIPAVRLVRGALYCSVECKVAVGKVRDAPYHRIKRRQSRQVAALRRATREYREIVQLATLLLPDAHEAAREHQVSLERLAQQVVELRGENAELRESAADLAGLVLEIVGKTKTLLPREIREWLDSVIAASGQLGDVGGVA